MTWKGWLRISVGVICLGLVFIFLMPPISGNLAAIGFLLLIGGWTNLNVVRQRWSHLRLLESGSIVVGRVVQQRFQNVRIGTDMIGRYSLIDYEFHTDQGLPMSGGGHDYSKSLYQDMPVLIFYAKEDPSCNVALGCSLYGVKDRPKPDA